MSDTSQAVDTAVDQSMPMVPLGPYKISRLVVGGNPLGGGSHMSPFVSKPMRRFKRSDAEVDEFLPLIDEVNMAAFGMIGQLEEIRENVNIAHEKNVYQGRIVWLMVFDPLSLFFILK